MDSTARLEPVAVSINPRFSAVRARPTCGETGAGFCPTVSFRPVQHHATITHCRQDVRLEIFLPHWAVRVNDERIPTPRTPRNPDDDQQQDGGDQPQDEAQQPDGEEYQKNRPQPPAPPWIGHCPRLAPNDSLITSRTWVERSDGQTIAATRLPCPSMRGERSALSLGRRIVRTRHTRAHRRRCGAAQST